MGSQTLSRGFTGSARVHKKTQSTFKDQAKVSGVSRSDGVGVTFALNGTPPLACPEKSSIKTSITRIRARAQDDAAAALQKRKS